MQDFEDIGMWERYCDPRDAGVAVQSTYARLDSSLPLEFIEYRYIMLGQVQYDDYESKNIRTTLGNAFSQFMLKKIAYRGEHEVRAVLDMLKVTPLPGINVPVDLDLLLESVYVSPYAHRTVVDTVESVCSKARFAGPIIHSTIRQVTAAY